MNILDDCLLPILGTSVELNTQQWSPAFHRRWCLLQLTAQAASQIKDMGIACFFYSKTGHIIIRCLRENPCNIQRQALSAHTFGYNAYYIHLYTYVYIYIYVYAHIIYIIYIYISVVNLIILRKTSSIPTVPHHHSHHTILSAWGYVLDKHWERDTIRG